jgi:hypothetical protein
MVGDGNAMGVCAQIAQHMFRSMKGRLAIDDPVLTEQYSKPGGRGSWVGQCSELAVELDAAFAEGIFECGHELAAEDTAEHFDGKKEGAVGRDPASVVWSKSTSGDDTVHMRVMTPTRTVP